MNKIYYGLILMLIISMLTCSCKKAEPDNINALEDVLIVYTNIDEDYRETDSPAEFTQADYDACKTRKTVVETTEMLIDKYRDYIKQIDAEFHPDDKEILNMLLTYDYVFRPVFHKNTEQFRQRLPIILNEKFLYNDYSQKWVGAYISVYRTKEFTEEIISSAVSIIDEYCPTLPEPNIEYINEFNLWQLHNSLSELLFVNIGDYERLNSDADISREWMRKASEGPK